MSSISERLSGLSSDISNGLTLSNIDSIEERVRDLASSIGSGTASQIQELANMQEQIAVIKLTLPSQEEVSSSQQQVSSVQAPSSEEVQALIERGQYLRIQNEAGKLSSKDAAAFQADAMNLFARDLNSGEKFSSVIAKILEFASTIQKKEESKESKQSSQVDQDAPAYVFQGARVLATGNENQYTGVAEDGLRSSCASNAVNFIAHSFQHDPNAITSADVRQIIRDGKATYGVLHATRMERLQLVAQSMSPQDRQVFLAQQAGQGMAPVDVMGPYEARLGERPHAPAGVVLPYGNMNAVKAHFQHTIDNVLKPQLPPHGAGKVGTVININGKTFAMTVERRADNSYHYYIFDSHGSQHMNGNAAGFIYKTGSQNDAVEYLSRFIHVAEPDPKPSNNPRNLNEISYSIIKPPVVAPQRQRNACANGTMMAVAVAVASYAIYALGSYAAAYLAS